MAKPGPAALLGAFATPEALVAAAKEARGRGLTGIDAHSPFPVDELNDVLGVARQPLSTWALVGGLTGLVCAYAMQIATNLDYPLRIGGRPLLAPQSFALIGFELTILFSVGAMAIGFFILNRLPRYHQPLFEVARFERASRDRFFLQIDTANADEVATARDVFAKVGALSVDEVPQ